MTPITPQEKRTIIDYVVVALTTTTPQQFGMNHPEGEGWFYINSKGNVGINLRHTEYSIGLIVKQYAAEHNEALANELEGWAGEHSRFFYKVFTSAMGRKAIKDFKVQMKLNNPTELKEKHTQELTEVNQDLKRLLARRQQLLTLLK